MKDNIDPRMHTAEHILNQTMVRMFGTKRCFTAHIEKKKSKCDYYMDRALSDEEVRRLEGGVNDVIAKDLKVSREAWPIDRIRTELKYEGGLEGGEINIVKVGDYDAVPCIGAHVGSTKEIGRFQIISTGFENGVLRIRYKLNKM
jgi:misacylated tRNA(Ala) deacylase